MTSASAFVHVRRVSSVVALVVLLAAAGSASDWPRFRGPNGAGVSSDTGVPVQFGERKNLHWKVEIPGSGNSSPIVSKQRIFLQTASTDGGERRILCLDLANGNTLWSQTAPGGTAKTHQKNTLASSDFLERAGADAFGLDHEADR